MLGPAQTWGDAAVPSLKDHSRAAILLHSFATAANSYRSFKKFSSLDPAGRVLLNVSNREFIFLLK